MDFTATWYSPSGGVGNGLTTKSGMKVSEELIAVDPTIIPLGSRVEIQYEDGHIERKLAADTGGAIKGKRLDIFIWDESDAVKNGKKHVKVRVVGHTRLGR